MKTHPDMVPLNDFRAQWHDIGDAAIQAISRVGASGWYVLGSEVTDFEQALASMWGTAEAVGCGSGLDAIEIGLRALGIRAGDRVLTTPLSAFATTLAIVRAGGTPVFVDVDDTGLVDLERCAMVLREQPDIRFFVPVHLYGHAIDLQALQQLRDSFDLKIVEDCAQAIGATSSSVAVGTVGQVGAVSFYPTKNLGCMGDGGAVLTADDELANAARCLRDYGQSEKYKHTTLGLNSRLDEVQAALLRDALLPRLDSYTAKRRRIAERYLADINSEHLVLPVVPNESESVWHLFPLQAPSGRDRLRQHLLAGGVQSGIHYPITIPDQQALEDVAGVMVLDALVRARAFASTELSLPIHPFLNEEQLDRVIEACNSWRP